MADSYEIRVTVTAGEGLAADEVVTIRNADRLTPADLFDQVGRGILAARHVIAGWQADAAECDGCGGTAEPLNENGMCPSCVRPDAEVDAQPPAQRLGQAVPTHTAELRRMADAVAQVWRPGGQTLGRQIEIADPHAEAGPRIAEVPRHCPRCESPDPRLHPAMQFEGEVQPCPDPWHQGSN